MHDQFPVALINKASGNFAFICKRFHIKMLTELGIYTDGVSNNSDTYKMHGIYCTLNFKEA